MSSQPGILAPPPLVGRGLELDLRPGGDARRVLVTLRARLDPARAVVGVGAPLLLALGRALDGLRAFPGVSGVGCAFPSTQAALWIFVRGAGTSETHDDARALLAALGDDVGVLTEVATFKYQDGRDLSGYLDGTANPVDSAAVDAAIVAGRGRGLDGSSYVAVQRWVHDLGRFAGMTPGERDLIIGRRLSDNAELADAPASAHVKRTEQEAFDPPAFMVRRSMPWGGVDAHGLYFVSYVESLDRYERLLRRMAGLDDGIVDGLMRFTRAVSGAYYWCPPLDDAGQLDWCALGE